ncbi:MAG TPA: hypothetical protein VGB26_04055 [Nitrospiria bacterium]
MKCPKCKGLMNFEAFVNIEVESMPWSYEGFRCIDCGEIIDPVILRNRRMSKTHDEQGDLVGVNQGSKT